MRYLTALERSIRDAERALEEVRKVLPDVLRSREVRGWSVMVGDGVFRLYHHTFDVRDTAKVYYNREEAVGTFEEVATAILGSELPPRAQGLLIAQMSELL